MLTKFPFFSAIAAAKSLLIFQVLVGQRCIKDQQSTLVDSEQIFPRWFSSENARQRMI